jgi:tetratricopeptide (TPR) repeat protein
MANEKKQDLYEVLGIDKSADERAIKKAYFALVRKYPPETHPEEFKKIREAYEVLSNPQSRKDYDSVAEYDKYGEEISIRLKAGMEAMDQGDFVTAQRAFHEVLRLQGNLHFARDLLGMAYLNNNQPAEALAQFDALVQSQPENAVYQLHKGYAHHHMKQYGPAMTAYRQARKLDEVDTRVLVAMADCLAEQKQYEAALEELDKAVAMDGKVDFDDFVFFMRKVQIQLLRNRADLAEQELDQIFKILPEDPDARKYVATRLASLAADLFAMKRSVDANRLLKRCKELDPSRKSMEYQFPARSKVKIASLPPKSQEWIAKHGKEFAAGKLQHSAWGGPIFGLICAIGLMLIALNAALNSRTLWSPGMKVFMILFSIGAPLLLGLAIRRVRRVAKSPYGKYTTIHPLHLMQVDVDEVTLWPLVNLHDVSLTHHSTNGVYQYTAVRLDFAGTICNLTIRGQQASVDWANQLLAQRRRVLELMSMGLLDAEEGFDLVPPTVLAGQAPTKTPADEAAKRQSMIWYGSFAGGGLLLGLIALPINAGAAEREAWRWTRNSHSVSDFRSYLARFPKGKHASEAKEKLDGLYADAVTAYKNKAQDADPKAIAAMEKVVNALKEGGAKRIKILYEGSVDFASLKGLDPKEFGDVIPPDLAFDASHNKTRESSITKSLRDAFRQVFSSDIVDFDDGSYGSYDYGYDAFGRYGPLKDQKSPVTFHIKYKVTPSGTLYESTTGKKKRLFGILFGWNFGIKIDGEAGDVYDVETPSAPAKNIRYTTYGDYEANSDIIPYTKMAESAFDDFGRKLAQSFGVNVPAPSDSYGGSYGSKYGSGSGGYGGGYGSKYGGGYGSKYGSGSSGSRPLDPEVQKIIDEAMRKAREKRGY